MRVNGCYHDSIHHPFLSIIIAETENIVNYQAIERNETVGHRLPVCFLLALPNALARFWTSNPGDIPRAQSARQQVYLPTQRGHSASGTVNIAPVRAKGAQGDDVFGFSGEKSQRKNHALWRGFPLGS